VVGPRSPRDCSVKRQQSRREWLAQATAAAAAGLAHTEPAPAAEPTRPMTVTYCLNTSTISGQKLDLVEVVEIAARAGYQAVEPWVSEIDNYLKKGGNLRDLGQRIKDRGLAVESAIDFFEWIVDDAKRRKQALEAARRSMDLVQQLGGRRIAAPPAGAIKEANLDLLKAAERYRALLDLGDRFGIVPQVEVWGFSKCLNRLGEAALVAMESGHPKACILPDVYHLYKGGSDPGGLRLLGPSAVQVFHFNDYPHQPRSSITDAARVYPGDGVAPLKEILRDLRQIGFGGVLSLELFNRDYWKQDALTVARTGLEKMRAAVQMSLS
jgi:2-keto-myo-inositol isomerase